MQGRSAGLGRLQTPKSVTPRHKCQGVNAANGDGGWGLSVPPSAHLTAVLPAELVTGL